MNDNFITPISRVGGMNLIGQTGEIKADKGAEFSDIFKNAINDVKQTQADLEMQQYLLATGQLDSVHSVTVAAAEAQLTVDMLVELRNKALESYNELLRVSL